MSRRSTAMATLAALVATLITVVAPAAAAADSSTRTSSSTQRADGHDPHERDDHLSGVGSVTWGACDNPVLQRFGAECGMLSVPLDYEHPRGTKIQLALSRVRHRVPDDKYQGIMLVNPGGPGGSGLIFSVFSFFIPNDVGGAYDWIGFDPRGVGSSVPALRCDPTYAAGPRPPYEPTTPAIERAWLTRASAYAAACGRAGGELLDHVKTIDTVDDMNAIRQSLGERQLNFFGFSYGTYLGQVFSSVYPHRVRRMVLDSNVDPRRVWYKANLDQDYAFDIVFGKFADWVASHDDVYHLGTTGAQVEARYYANLHALAAHPVGQLGAAELNDAVLIAGYIEASWPDVAAALAALDAGDAGPATDLFLNVVNTTDDNSYAMYLAVECTDASWPTRWSVWRRDNDRVAAAAPFVTWGNAWFNAPCAFWPAESSHPVEVRGDDAPPILLLDETYDGATPFSGSLEVRRRFPSSSLIETDGGTNHANSLAGNACVDDQIAAYLVDGTLPARLAGNRADAHCAAAPLPEPAPAAAAATAAAAGASSQAAARLRLAVATIGR